LADLNEALRLAPDRAALFMRRGGVYFDGGDAERALPDFLEALRLDPGHPSNHYNHGLAAERLGRTAEAVASFRRALELQPGMQDAIHGLRRLGVAA
jgi:tetratricopeptide (TPR) repeat protein